MGGIVGKETKKDARTERRNKIWMEWFTEMIV